MSGREADFEEGPHQPTRSRAPWLGSATVATGLGLLGVAVLAVVVLTGTHQGDAGLAPSARASRAPASAPASMATESAEPIQSSGPTFEPPPASWAPVAAIGNADDPAQSSTELYDLVAWHSGYLALGRQYDGALQPPVVESRAVAWASGDGLAWAEHLASFEGEEVQITGLVALPDGQFMAISIELAPELVTGPASLWLSSDGITWSRATVPAERRAPAWPLLAVGPQGTLLSIDGQIFSHAGGDSWELLHQEPPGWVVYELVAGDDGFLARSGHPQEGFDRIQASADGRDWLEADARVSSVTPLDGDWLGIARDFAADGGISVWRSGNGLEWEQVLDVNDLTGPDGPKSGLGMASGVTGAVLVSAGGEAFVSLRWNHCCVLLDRGVGVYRSTDGLSWTDAGLGEAAIQAAAANSNGLVLGGILNRGDQVGVWFEER